MVADAERGDPGGRCVSNWNSGAPRATASKPNHSPSETAKVTSDTQQRQAAVLAPARPAGRKAGDERADQREEDDDGEEGRGMVTSAPPRTVQRMTAAATVMIVA